MAAAKPNHRQGIDFVGGVTEHHHDVRRAIDGG